MITGSLTVMRQPRDGPGAQSKLARISSDFVKLILSRDVHGGPARRMMEE